MKHLYEYTGPVFVNKASSEQKNLERQQAAFYQQLTQWAGQMYGEQNQITQMIRTAVKPLMVIPKVTAEPTLAGATGLTPEEQTAMTTQLIDQNSLAYQNAKKTLQNQAFILGGREMPSGALLKGLRGLEESRISGTQAGLMDIGTLNAGLKRQQYESDWSKWFTKGSQDWTNYWNAIQATGGVGQMTNPIPYISAATEGGKIAYGMAAQNNQSFWTGIGQKLLGGAIGGGLALGTAGGANALGIPAAYMSGAGGRG